MSLEQSRTDNMYQCLSRVRMSTSREKPSLYALPPEIRLEIYEYVVGPQEPIKLVFACDTPSSLSLAPRTFQDPTTDDWLIFTRKYPPRTIHLQQQVNDRIEECKVQVHRSRRPDIALLHVSKQLYSEILPILWNSMHLDFTQAFPALIPFASSLSPLARVHLNHIILRAPFHNGINQHAWSATCAYMDSQLNLKHLTVEYRYRSGTCWTSEQWQRKLALDPHTRRPSDPAVRDALDFGSDSFMLWEDVLLLDEYNRPKDIEFLEGLQLETEDEMRRSLGLEAANEGILDSSLAALSQVRGLNRLDLKFIGGGLTATVSAELRHSLEGQMVQKRG